MKHGKTVRIDVPGMEMLLEGSNLLSKNLATECRAAGQEEDAGARRIISPSM
jgi:hypothetical protein